MKKAISVILIFALIAVLASCGKSKDSEAKDDIETTTSSTVAETESTTVTEETTSASSAETTQTKRNAENSKPATTKSPTTTPSKSNTYRVDPSTVPSYIGTTKEAWRVQKFNGLDITISRIKLNKTVSQYISNQNFYSSSTGQIVNPHSISYNPVCTVAVIDCDSPTRLKISKGDVEKRVSTEGCANSVGAVIATNGHADSYFEHLGAVIRDGQIYKSYTGEGEPHFSKQRLIMYKDGTWKFSTLSNETAEKEIRNGAYNSIRFQSAVIQDGKIVASDSTDIYRNRTYLGRISSTRYVMMVTELMPISDAADVLKAYGCNTAVLVQGGNCAQMYVKEIGNSTGSTGDSVRNLNKVGYLETECLANNGFLAQGKKGGPCTDHAIDIIYFK